MDPTSAVFEDSSRPEGAATATKALRILMVDDSEAIRVFMKAKLKIIASERYELHLDTAPSGEDALASCARQPYDLVFMDVVMPGMGGIEACHRHHGPGWRLPPAAARLLCSSSLPTCNPARPCRYTRPL